jgi:1-acyl-sn-glycerol-3-phosphate acyltransferase
MSGEGWLHSQMDLPRIGPAGWVRVVVRGAPLAAVIYGGLALLLLVRLVERPICGMDRPVSPWITQGVCRAAVWLMGLRLVVRGQPMRGRGAVVANHASWLDIFVLNAVDRVYFVSKAEVAGWAGIGWLARATGTVFITRKGAEAREQQRLFEARLRAGHRLCFFPEGTSTDSRRILPFKSTLFAAFFTHGMEHVVQLQPVTVVYRPASGMDLRFFGWWGEMDFAPHLLSVLAARRGGDVQVVLHEPRPADAFSDRKTLAAWCEATVRGAHPDGQVAHG